MLSPLSSFRCLIVILILMYGCASCDRGPCTAVFLRFQPAENPADCLHPNESGELEPDTRAFVKANFRNEEVCAYEDGYVLRWRGSDGEMKEEDAGEMMPTRQFVQVNLISADPLRISLKISDDSPPPEATQILRFSKIEGHFIERDVANRLFPRRMARVVNQQIRQDRAAKAKASPKKPAESVPPTAAKPDDGSESQLKKKPIPDGPDIAGLKRVTTVWGAKISIDASDEVLLRSIAGHPMSLQVVAESLVMEKSQAMAGKKPFDVKERRNKWWEGHQQLQRNLTVHPNGTMMNEGEVRARVCASAIVINMLRESGDGEVAQYAALLEGVMKSVSDEAQAFLLNRDTFLAALDRWVLDQAKPGP